MIEQRKKLTDILDGNGRGNLSKAWGEAKAADDFAALPAGEYIAHITDGQISTAKTGTPGYKLTFKVLDGEHTGRMFWHDIWLTPAAMPMAKRDLSKLGITELEQLENPIPRGIRCKVKLALRKDDDGNDRNRVKSFDVIGIDTPQADAFAPTATTGGTL